MLPQNATHQSFLADPGFAFDPQCLKTIALQLGYPPHAVALFFAETPIDVDVFYRRAELIQFISFLNEVSTFITNFLLMEMNSRWGQLTFFKEARLMTELLFSSYSLETRNYFRFGVCIRWIPSMETIESSLTIRVLRTGKPISSISFRIRGALLYSEYGYCHLL